MPSLLSPGPSVNNFFSINSSMPFPSFFFRNRKKCYALNPPEENHQVTYLGNMLTVMGKGDASVDRPLEVITRAWGNATGAKGARNGGAMIQQQQQQLAMRLCVCRSGLRAETCLGVTEYFANRITWSAAPSQYPRVFCWVYKHEGKRMKPELRCHAVLCRRADEPQLIHQTLHKHLQSALQEYKREKVATERTRHRHNSVLLAAGAVAASSSSFAAVPSPCCSSTTPTSTTTSASSSCNTTTADGAAAVAMAQHQHMQQTMRVPPMLPRRKAVLQTGSLNYRPPLSRSRSVPRLCSIDEEETRAEEEQYDQSAATASFSSAAASDEQEEAMTEAELLLLLSDVDSLNMAAMAGTEEDNCRPIPTTPTTASGGGSDGTTVGTPFCSSSSVSCSSCADQTATPIVTDSSCRSSAYGECDEEEEEEQSHDDDYCDDSTTRTREQHNNCCSSSSDQDDGCSADSGYSPGTATTTTMAQQKEEEE